MTKKRRGKASGQSRPDGGQIADTYLHILTNPSFNITPSSRSAPTMTDKLPQNLLALFAPRPALRYLPPSDHAPEDRRTSRIGGVAAFLDAMKEHEKAPYTPTESWLERKARIKAEKKEKQEKLTTEGFAKCEWRSPFLGCANKRV
jgi:hypothetical protein